MKVQVLCLVYVAHVPAFSSEEINSGIQRHLKQGQLLLIATHRELWVSRGE